MKVWLKSYLISSLVLLSWDCFSIDTVSEGFKVLSGSTVAIDAHGTCQQVSNASGVDQFVATKTSAEWSSFRSNLPSGMSLGSCSTPPSSLALSHTTNSKSVLLSWSAGSGNGGAGGCKLQYNDGAWKDLTSGSSIDCDSSSASASFSLEDTWFASWNGAQIRMVRNSDSGVMGVFSTGLSCATQSESTSATPSIDEDCDGSWDNTSTGYAWFFFQNQAANTITFANPQTGLVCDVSANGDARYVEAGVANVDTPLNSTSYTTATDGDDDSPASLVYLCYEGTLYH